MNLTEHPGEPLPAELPFDDVEVFLYLQGQMPTMPMVEVADLTINFRDWQLEGSHSVVPVDSPPLTPWQCVRRGLGVVGVVFTLCYGGYYVHSSDDVWTGPFRDPRTYTTTDGQTVIVWGRHRVLP